MSELQQQADEVLQSRRQRNDSRACYPCSKRKVRCSGEQPCSVCKRRGHPNICFFPEQAELKRASKRKRAAGRRQNENDVVNSDASLPEQQTSSMMSLAGQPTAAVTPIRQKNDTTEQSLQQTQGPHRSTASPGATTIGGYSMASFVHERLADQDKDLSKDFRHGLGLQNHVPDVYSGAKNPFLGVSDMSMGDARITKCAKRSEVLEFFQPLRTCLISVYSVISNVDELEMSMFSFVEKIESLNSVEHQTSEAFSALQATEAALHLALLALGAQFSTKSSGARATISQDFAQRSISFLNLPYALLTPSLQLAQTLLVLGMYMQNAGMSDAAWTLLGTTSRMAQSLVTSRDQSDQDYERLRESIAWQDSLISLRFGRAPSSVHIQWICESLASGLLVSYRAAMAELNRVCLSYLSSAGKERPAPAHASEQVTQLDAILEHAASHLQSEANCKTMQQRVEYFMLRMHSSFLRAEICRPFLVQTGKGSRPDPSSGLSDRCIDCLCITVEAYVQLSKISHIPLRSWSLMHEAMTCACVLALLNITRAIPNVNVLLTNIRQLLEAELGSEAMESHHGNWTFSRALKLLRLLLDRAPAAPEAGSEDAQQTLDVTGSGQALAESSVLLAETVGDYDEYLAFDPTFGSMWDDMSLSGLNSSLASIFDRSAEPSHPLHSE